MSTPDLPVGFTELEYLESSGTQAIHLGYYDITPDFGYDTKHAAVRSYLSGIIGDLDSTFLFIIWPHGQIAFRYFTNEVVPKYLTTNQTYELKKRGVRNWIDGVEVTSNTATESTGVRKHIGVFCAGYKDYLRAAIRLWYARIYDGDDLLTSLVPVLDADKIACLYDKVTRQCFYNTGTGTFGYKIKATGEVVAPVSV